MRFVRNSLLTLVSIVLFGTADVRAQEPVFVHVDTNYPEAVLYVDSQLVGVVSESPDSVPATSRSLRLVAPDANTWSVAPVSTRLDAEAGDTVRVQLDFPYYYRIESIPFGADVLVEHDEIRRKIGETPLLYRSSEPIEGRLVISSVGYALERVSPGRQVWNRHVVSLSQSDDLDPSAAVVNWQPPKKHRAWIDYAAVGAAVAAGALAVHYKFRADDLYAEYEDTGDPSIRSNIHAYDTRAGIALGAMQVGIGVFAVRLALR